MLLSAALCSPPLCLAFIFSEDLLIGYVKAGVVQPDLRAVVVQPFVPHYHVAGAVLPLDFHRFAEVVVDDLRSRGLLDLDRLRSPLDVVAIEHVVQGKAGAGNGRQVAAEVGVDGIAGTQNGTGSTC